MSSPPPFENKPQCNKCGTKFTLITRQHHCRNCGRSYCNNCSKANIPLPHYRLSEPQRVCDECLAHVQEHYSRNKGAAPASTGGSSSLPQERAVVTPSPSTVPASAPPAASTASFMSSQYSAQPAQPLNNNNSHSSFLSSGPAAPTQPTPLTSNSGYAAPAASSAASVSSAAASTTAGAAAAAVRRPAAPSASGVQAFGQFSGFGRSAAPKYDLSADQAKLNDQCRDAIKNNDSAGVVALLGAGADARYVDHTGNSLLHLAAMFDRFDIAKALLTSGASLTLKNPAGETPLDIAPPAMQHKLQALATA